MSALTFSDALMMHSRVWYRRGEKPKRYYGYNSPEEGWAAQDVKVCRALADRQYTAAEQEALLDTFLEYEKPLTEDQVAEVLLLVALDAYWEEDIPF